jgi:hypothetical protein
MWAIKSDAHLLSKISLSFQRAMQLSEAGAWVMCFAWFIADGFMVCVYALWKKETVP